MSNKRRIRQKPQQEVKINPKDIMQCKACGMICPVVQLVDGSSMVVQPMPVQPIVPARPKIHLSGPTPPAVALKKLLEQTWEGTAGAPVFIPHAAVCPRGVEGAPPLLQSLNPPKEIMDAQRQAGEGDIRGEAEGGEGQEGPRRELSELLGSRED